MEMATPKLNANPTVIARAERPNRDSLVEAQELGGLWEDAIFEGEEKEEKREPFTSEEVFELLRDIQDPEHPLTLEQLSVIKLDGIDIKDNESRLTVHFTPTVPHCSMSTLIGLSLRVKLLRSLPPRFKVDIFTTPGSHAQEDQVNKQLNDKERVAAAL